MRVKNFTALFCRINDCYSKSRYFRPHTSFLITVSRSFYKWDIVGAACLERKPVLTQCLTPLEERYLKHIQTVELEKSYLSNFEKRQIEEKRIEQKMKAGTLEDMDLVSKQTAQDFEDACMEELKKFKHAPRVTVADIQNDRRSTHRRLDASIVFVIKEKLGNEFKWVLPQAIHEEGETLRQTAERALNQVATSDGKIEFMGNAPIGYYKYKYPKAMRGNGVVGAKVFFFKAVLLDSKEGSVVVNKSDNISDYLWLTHRELEEVLVPVLYKTVMSFLYPDMLSQYILDDHVEENQPTPSVIYQF